MSRAQAALGRRARQCRLEILPELVRRGVKPDVVTDQTSAHDPVNGYLPAGWTLAEWEERRVRDPKAVEHAAKQSMAVHVRAMLEFWRRGVPTLDYGNNIRQMAKEMGVADAFDFPGFVPAYIRPLFCRGIGPFRWAALSGDPEDIFRTDAKVKELMPHDRHLHNWLDMAQSRIRFQGLPARICWVGLGDRHRLGLAFNEMVASGELAAPIVIGRDHLDSGSVASPNRETEAMKDGSDAVSDWPLLNALLNCASGATWVSFHHGGGVGIGYSQHAGMVIVCDGTPEAARRIERVLWNDPASGVMRHADAGYDEAIACAREFELKLPSAVRLKRRAVTDIFPLAGVRVLDFSRLLAGPFCTAMLADLGAEVIKVESREGDDYRHIGPFVNGESALFALVNRGKRSVVLDLKTPEGQRAARALAIKSDVVVENFRPGVADRLGVGYAELARGHPSWSTPAFPASAKAAAMPSVRPTT